MLATVDESRLDYLTGLRMFQSDSISSFTNYDSHIFRAGW